MNSKRVKALISKAMTDRRMGISVVLGESDPDHDRIEIKYPKADNNYLSLNPITGILRKHNFYIAQVIDFYYPNKRVVLLIRNPKK